MPSNGPTRQARAFHHASDLTKDVWRALLQNEAAANVILPFAKKALNLPRGDGEQLWISLCDDANQVEFVLSCTRGQLGNYPIFILACKSSAQPVQDEKQDKHLADSLLPLVCCLLDQVPPQRVFSVFSVAKVTEAFAKILETEAHARHAYGIRAIKSPYYDATFTFCTGETLKKSVAPMTSFLGCEDVSISLRAADMSQLKGIASMCKAFSETSPPFVLDDTRAEAEAESLITNKQVWVHMIKKADEEPEIACIVATTRESENVTAVTKVFTTEHWRGRGCAARLLHRVCQDILRKKQRAVLYVGNSDELAPARNVYHKIGFQGLNGPPGQQLKGVERWLEIGFEGTDLGYW